MGCPLLPLPCIRKNFQFGLAPSAVIQITFSPTLSTWRTSSQQMGNRRFAVTPVVAKWASGKSNLKKRPLTIRTRSCLAMCGRSSSFWQRRSKLSSSSLILLRFRTWLSPLCTYCKQDSLSLSSHWSLVHRTSAFPATWQHSLPCIAVGLLPAETRLAVEIMCVIT